MACQLWSEKLDLYLDGELPPDEQRRLREHMRGCVDCSSESLDQLRAKRAIQLAGQRFVPDPAFRARIQAGIHKKAAASRPAASSWRWLATLTTSAAAARLIFGALFIARDRSREQHLIGELADLHVATLASASPVDVVSTDRHTVKPWFEGKIPFTFNLPGVGQHTLHFGGRTESAISINHPARNSFFACASIRSRCLFFRSERWRECARTKLLRQSSPSMCGAGVVTVCTTSQSATPAPRTWTNSAIC